MGTESGMFGNKWFRIFLIGAMETQEDLYGTDKCNESDILL